MSYRSWSLFGAVALLVAGLIWALSRVDGPADANHDPRTPGPWFTEGRLTEGGPRWNVLASSRRVTVLGPDAMPPGVIPEEFEKRDAGFVEVCLDSVSVVSVDAYGPLWPRGLTELVAFCSAGLAGDDPTASREFGLALGDWASRQAPGRRGEMMRERLLRYREAGTLDVVGRAALGD